MLINLKGSGSLLYTYFEEFGIFLPKTKEQNCCRKNYSVPKSGKGLRGGEDGPAV